MGREWFSLFLLSPPEATRERESHRNIPIEQQQVRILPLFSISETAHITHIPKRGLNFKSEIQKGDLFSVSVCGETTTRGLLQRFNFWWGGCQRHRSHFWNFDSFWEHCASIQHTQPLFEKGEILNVSKKVAFFIFFFVKGKRDHPSMHAFDEGKMNHDKFQGGFLAHYFSLRE